MSASLRVLLVEDNVDDAFLLIRHLRKEGYDINHLRVETASAMEIALHEQEWDLVIADFSLPQFSAPAALNLVKDMGLDLPFIIVSRVIGEESAVEALKAGAHDYIRKDKLARLIPAIERELREAGIRQERKRAQEELMESQRTLSTLMSNLPGMAYRRRYQSEALMEFVSEGCRELTGYKPNQLIHNESNSFTNLILDEDRETVWRTVESAIEAGVPYQIIYRITTARNETRWVQDKGRGVDYLRGTPRFLEGFITDITDRKRAEEERTLIEEQLRNAVLDSIITVDRYGRITQINQSAAALFRVKPDEATGMNLHDICTPGRESIAYTVERSLQNKEYIRELKLSGQQEGVSWTCVLGVTPIREEGEEGAVVIIRDISRLHLLEQEIFDKFSFSHIIGKSPVMQKIFDIVRLVADTDSTVLVQGPSGTGKELIAAAIHSQSHRNAGPFVKVNCAALPDNLLESELFGHVRGSFTGATRDKAGRFEVADKGTIFLDEIGDISPALQQRLLRVLQERELERVGSTTTIKIDIRILAATNRDLSELVAAGTFREDLYYRLNVVSIHVPPLCSRKEDIPLLVRHFLQRFQSRMGGVLKEVDSDAMNVLLNYNWPGNVRQLENAIEHAVVLSSDGMIHPGNLPQDIQQSIYPSRPQAIMHPPTEPVAPVESKVQDTGQNLDAQTIKHALVSSGWKRSLAARKLGIHRSTLWRLMKEHNISPPGI